MKNTQKSPASAKNWQLTKWAAVVAWAVLIWMLSSVPNLDSGLQQDEVLRKIAHATEYAVLTGLLLVALRSHIRSWTLVGGYAALIALAYTLVDEIHQTFVVSRDGSIDDMVVDAVGIGAALIIAHWLLRYRRYRRPMLTK